MGEIKDLEIISNLFEELAVFIGNHSGQIAPHILENMKTSILVKIQNDIAFAIIDVRYFTATAMHSEDHFNTQSL